jgi:hypothetical protein
MVTKCKEYFFHFSLSILVITTWATINYHHTPWNEGKSKFIEKGNFYYPPHPNTQNCKYLSKNLTKVSTTLNIIIFSFL